MQEFKRITNFRNYAINKDGKVINFHSLREVKPIKGYVNLTGTSGKRSTRRIHLLLKDLFGDKNEK